MLLALAHLPQRDDFAHQRLSANADRSSPDSINRECDLPSAVRPLDRCYSPIAMGMLVELVIPDADPVFDVPRSRACFSSDAELVRRLVRSRWLARKGLSIVRSVTASQLNAPAGADQGLVYRLLSLIASPYPVML